MMLRWDCHWVRRHLALLAGGDLPVADRRRAERHLAGCGACRRVQAAWVRSLEPLREAAAAPAPALAGPPLWPAVRSQLLAPRPPLRGAFNPAALIQWLPAGALTAACVLVIVLGATQPSRVSPDPSSAWTPGPGISALRSGGPIEGSAADGPPRPAPRPIGLDPPVPSPYRTVGFDLSASYLPASEPELFER